VSPVVDPVHAIEISSKKLLRLFQKNLPPRNEWAEYVERRMRCQGELAYLQYQI
jgi:hypothetical protein